MCKVCIIVPVYNVEIKLTRCLDSILCMEFSDFELIVIDDGSTDKCSAICDAFAAKDSRIKVLHKKNGGAGSARNAGLEIAKGKYIVFCDSDDYYDSQLMSKMLNDLPETPDENTLYAFNFRNVWPDFIEENGPYVANEIFFSNFEDHVTFLSSRTSHRMMGYSIWDKVYTKSLIDKYQIRMPERDALGHKDDWAEDLFFNLSYCQHINHIKVLETPAYMLSKHGAPDQQNENNLVGRLDYIMDFFTWLENTNSIINKPSIKTDFWKLIIWHLKRYFDLDCANNCADGYKALRSGYLKSRHWNALNIYIKTALKNWNEYGQRWNNIQSKEYKYFLQFLIDGNTFIFKVKNKLLYSCIRRTGG